MFGFFLGEFCDLALVLLLAPFGLYAERRGYWRAVREAEAAFVRGDEDSLVSLLRAVQPYGPPAAPEDDFYDRVASCLIRSDLARAATPGGVQQAVETCAERSEGDVLRYVPSRRALIHVSRFLARRYSGT